MKFLSFLVLLFSLNACQNNQGLSVVSMGNLLHDNSSKMWMVQSDVSEGKQFAPENNNFKTVLIFYKSGKFAEQPLNTIGNRPPKYGEFSIYGHNEQILFDLGDGRSVFRVITYSKEGIILHSDYSTLELIPLPEL